MDKPALLNFEAQLYERAENWLFEVTIQAATESDAWKQVRKDYPKNAYSVRSLRSVYTPSTEGL